MLSALLVRQLMLLVLLGWLAAGCKGSAAPDAAVERSTPANVRSEGTTTNTNTGTRAASASVDGGGAHVAFMPTVIPAAAPRPRAQERTAREGEVLRIPVGTHRLGSSPGELDRDPAVEADGTPLEVPAFDIDALPYPNDPEQPVRLGATRDEAEALCRQRNRRLCSEIEWERACRGPQDNVFPGADLWDAERCGGRGAPGACASGFGALVMGTRAAEWTRDSIDDRAIIRGANSNAPAAQHRCAARRTAVPSEAGLQLAFRCCGGAVPSLAYPREVSRPPFREEPMTNEQVRAIIANIPELARVREGFAMFSPAAITEVLNHGATTRELHPEAVFTVSPVRWSPTFGEELLVFVGTSNSGSFVAALWVLPPDEQQRPRYRHAASFILAGDRVAMTLAYGRGTREEIQWSACWNCGGEHGVVAYDREHARAIAVQR